jgi:Fic family protein
MCRTENGVVAKNCENIEELCSSARQTTGKMLMKTYWMNDRDIEQLCDVVPRFSEYSDKYSSHEAMADFRKHKSIAIIYDSNKLEDTLPKSAKEHETYQILYSLLNDIENEECVSLPWPADGQTNDGNASKQQMYHHLKAYQYLCERRSNGTSLYNQKLTVDVILTAHQLLMENTQCETREQILNGTFRSHPVHAGDYVYLSHESIPREVENIVQKFNRDKEAGVHPIKLAANLFYELITVHPFSDGNGRLCRLMATFALFATGTPFAVSITSGHTRSRRHYIDCILRARQIGSDRKYLYTLFASSVESGWANFIENLKPERVHS